jgi:mRNA interferase RelE/StbE
MMMLGKNEYALEYVERVAKEDIPDLPRTMRDLIKKAIELRLQADPVSFGKPLRYSLKGLRSMRVGDYRVVYRIDGKAKKIIISAIKHRKDVYDDLEA